MRLRAHYYQQFDADLGLDVPAEGYGGRKTTDVDLDLKRVALVSMHAWRFDGPEQHAGLYRAVEYLPRSEAILKTVYPSLLAAARAAGMHVLHVVGSGKYYAHYKYYSGDGDNE